MNPSGPGVARSGKLPPAAWRVVLATAAAYLLAGVLALQVALPPSYASPLYPAAGIALATVLVYGRPALLGVLLGALGTGVLTALPQQEHGLALWLVPPIISLAALLQALASSALVWRNVPQPLSLGEPMDVVRFCVLGALVGCLVGATVATGLLSLGGLLQPGQRTMTWWTWWAGDALGVLITAPIVLALVGRPRDDWVPRRITVALPLLVTSVLLAAGTLLVVRWDAQRIRTVFDRDAVVAITGLQAKLDRAHDALEAMRGLFLGSDDVSSAEFRLASAPWLTTDNSIQALGFSQRIDRSDQAGFEARTAAQDGVPLRVFDRPVASGEAASPPGPDMVVIRHIEPMAGNAAARGVNALSIAAAREAIERSAALDQAWATAPFRLTQGPQRASGVVLYRAIYSSDIGGGAAGATGEPASSQRRARLRGVVFATLRTEQLVAAARAAAPRYLHWCLTDDNATAGQPLLAGSPGCNQPGKAAPAPSAVADLLLSTPPLAVKHRLLVAGRSWSLTLSAEQTDVPDVGHSNARVFSAVGLSSAALLTVLLLTLSGRTRRIEVAVAERTSDLQREVAERERTASALRDSERQLRNIFDHAPAGIVYADLEGRVRAVNPRMCAMLGQDAEVLTQQQDLAAIAVAEDRAEMTAELRRLLRGELQHVQRRLRLRHRDGSVLWAETHWSLLRDLQGHPKWLLAVAEDITERLKRQEAEQGRQLAESANRAKNEFLSRMSHELRTPLNAMLGFAQLLELDRQHPLTTHQAVWVAQILQAGWHLLEMINDTLDLSRIEAGVLRLEARPVDLAPLVQQCVDMLAPQAAAQQISITVRLGPGATDVQGDATRLRQVLTNLLSNAVKYNLPGGQVLVTSERTPDQQVQLRVHDTGVGLSAEQLAQLFQPFNRLGRERGSTEGTGIGLVISRRLAELMGGGLDATSTEGQGATFILQLPAAVREALPPQAAPAHAALQDGYRHRHVQYIEDNETNIEVMRGILLQRPQVRLTVSMTAADGLAAVHRDPPDLLLLDLHLPDGDGIDLLRQLKADARTVDLPVLVLSADATPTRVSDALAAGALQYLTKPLNVEALLALIDSLLDEVDTRSGELSAR